MGLDSSLYKEKSFYGWGEKYTVSVKGEIDKEYPPRDKDFVPTNWKQENLGYLTITTEIAYWRKANQIHNWFVETLGGGEDNCQRIYCTVDNLKELLETCKKVKKASKLVEKGTHKVYSLEESKQIDKPYKVIEDPTVAQQLLPTTEGFFFGSTEYDEYYLEDIDNTIEQLTKILKDLENESEVSVFYQASW